MDPAGHEVGGHLKTAQWSTVKLGDVLTPSEDWITIDPSQTYREVTVRLWGKGVKERGVVPGSSLSGSSRLRVHANEFIVSKIDARNGAFGLVPEELEGAVVSSDFPVFRTAATRVLPEYLGWLCRTHSFVEMCGRASEGTTNRVRLRIDRFLAQEIEVPRLEDQRHIVARIEELDAQIHEARTHHRQASEEIEALLVSFRRATFGENPLPSWIPLGNFVERIVNGKSPATEGRRAAADEWAVLKVGAVSFGVFDERENKALPATYVVPPLMEVLPGDFIMSRANTVELVGACALVRKTRQRLMLSDKTFRFVFREPRNVLPEYLEQVLKSPPLREQIEHVASGTSPTMKNISKEKVLALRLPPIALPEQRRIVTKLEALQAEVETLKRLQGEIATELDALLLAILDRAFKGELV
jgi:type I restriction enzyme S subunit